MQRGPARGSSVRCDARRRRPPGSARGTSTPRSIPRCPAMKRSCRSSRWDAPSASFRYPSSRSSLRDRVRTVAARRPLGDLHVGACVLRRRLRQPLIRGLLGHDRRDGIADVARWSRLAAAGSARRHEPFTKNRVRWLRAHPDSRSVRLVAPVILAAAIFPATTNASAKPAVKRVFVYVMENTSYDSVVVGAKDAPYLNSLIKHILPRSPRTTSPPATRASTTTSR